MSFEQYHLGEILTTLTNPSNNSSNGYNVNYFNNININLPVPGETQPRRNHGVPDNEEIRTPLTSNTRPQSTNISHIEPIVTTININDLDNETINSITSSIDDQLTNLYNRVRNSPNNQIEAINTNTSVTLSQLSAKSSLICITNNNIDKYKEDNNCCSICNQPFILNNIVRKLNTCPHFFHQQCVDQWFCTNSTCPICRNDLNSTQPINNIESSTQPIYLNRNNIININDVIESISDEESDC